MRGMMPGVWCGRRVVMVMVMIMVMIGGGMCGMVVGRVARMGGDRMRMKW
jgi:hypothetical protein